MKRTNSFTKNFINKSYKFVNLNINSSKIEKFNFNGDVVFLKRDDQLELGSSKQRSIIPLMYYYINNGTNKFVVSSSGNAGIVSSYFALNSSIELDLVVFLSENISEIKKRKFYEKLNLGKIINYEHFSKKGLSHKNLTINYSDDPRKELFTKKQNGYLDMRGSSDDLALLGFEEISNEIINYKYFPSEIYIPASSGSTAIGVYNGFVKNKFMPKINIIQTTKTFALTKRLINQEFEIEDNHPADSIVDIIGSRRLEIENIINESQGKVFVINSKQVLEAKKILKDHNIITSFDSALTLAAYLKDDNKSQNSMLLFTGS